MLAVLHWLWVTLGRSLNVCVAEMCERGLSCAAASLGWEQCLMLLLPENTLVMDHLTAVPQLQLWHGSG